MLVCLVTMCATHAPKEPGFHTLGAVLCFRAPCCAGERSVCASGLGMWLQEGRGGQVSGAVGGTSVVEAGDCPWVCHVSSRAKATSFRTVKVMRFFPTPLGSVCLWNLFSDLVSFKKELTDRITRLLLTYFGIAQGGLELLLQLRTTLSFRSSYLPSRVPPRWVLCAATLEPAASIKLPTEPHPSSLLGFCFCSFCCGFTSPWSQVPCPLSPRKLRCCDLTFPQLPKAW